MTWELNNALIKASTRGREEKDNFETSEKPCGGELKQAQTGGSEKEKKSRENRVPVEPGIRSPGREKSGRRGTTMEKLKN